MFKELLAGIVLLVLVGFAGFLYRNVMEHPHMTLPGVATACTEEAKLCPDGSSVGRTGPDCAFAPCSPPNVEIPEAGLAFALPAGYEQLEAGAPDQSTLRIFQKASTTEALADVITIGRYPISATGTPMDAMIANTVLDPSGLHPKGPSAFTQTTINGNTFLSITVGRFEGQIETAYYLPIAGNVLKFDLTERGVSDWSDPKLDIDSLPEHQAFVTMLSTLEVTRQ